MYQLPDAAKRKLCEIPLVSQVCLVFDRIESIELSQNSRLSDSAMLAVADKIILQSWYYQHLLNEPLPKLHNFTLNEMINGWRLLQSLASVVFDAISSRIFHNARELPRFASVEELLRCAPKIDSRVLCATVSKALRMEKHRAQQLVEVLVFRDKSSQEVWTQPLVRCEDDYWLVLPCIHAVHLERIVEGWMRQGGLELERRGPEFERFCRKVLQIFGFLSPFGDIPLWNILVSCIVLPYISLLTHVNRMLWGHILSVAPETSSMEGGAAFISTPATTVLTRLLPDATTLSLEACAV